MLGSSISRGSDKGLIDRDLLLDGGVTPSIVLAEIARKYLKEGVPIEDTRRRLLFVEGKTLVKHIDMDKPSSWEGLSGPAGALA